MFNKPYQSKPRQGLEFVDDDGLPVESLTKQAHKDECDINKIVANYDRTGLISHVSASTARYGDFTEVNEYQESLNTVLRAQRDFDALPADVRKRFGNNPGEFFEFATNPDNHDQMVEMGLAEARSIAPEPTAAPEQTKPPEGE